MCYVIQNPPRRGKDSQDHPCGASKDGKSERMLCIESEREKTNSMRKYLYMYG
jgi:hypothetical protein